MFLPGNILLIYIPVSRNQVWRCELPFSPLSLIGIHQCNRLRVPSMQRYMTQSRLYKNTVWRGGSRFSWGLVFHLYQLLKTPRTSTPNPFNSLCLEFRRLKVVFSFLCDGLVWENKFFSHRISLTLSLCFTHFMDVADGVEQSAHQ